MGYYLEDIFATMEKKKRKGQMRGWGWEGLIV
jgi:hypothetical protein